MLEGLVADAHRSHAAVAGERRHFALVEAAFERDPVHRLQVAVRRLADDVGQVAQVMLHGVHFGQRVERAHDEERVAQPAVAVIPVAPAAGGFRDAGRHRGDDRAGLLERAELERDGGAQHGVLPFRRDREPARPLAPVRLGVLLERARDRADAVGKGLVGAEREAHLGLQQERGFCEHVADGRVRGQPQHAVRADVADVIAAVGDLRAQRAVAERRPELHADSRRAGDRAHPAHAASAAGTCARCARSAGRNR